MAETPLEALQLLCDDRSTTNTPAWGYLFPAQTRWSYYSAGAPNVVVTSFAIAALTEAAGALGIESFATRAQSAGAWILEQLFDLRQGIFVYRVDGDVLIHKANLLGARAVHQVGLHSEWLAPRLSARCGGTLEAQQAGGSWP